MSTFDDFDDVIAAEVPDELVEELIRGAFEPELPSELVLVGRVLRAAQGPIPGEDRAREAEVVDAMVNAMRVTPLAAPRSSRRVPRRAFVAIVAAASVLGVGGVAAAAGSLPPSIQTFVHDSLSQVGVSVPSADDAPAPPALEPETSDGNGVEAPGQSENAPGQSGNTPGQSGTAPGQTGNTPGQSGEAPGQSGGPPGQSGEAPGKSGDAPGQSGEAPGKSGDAPGQIKKTAEVPDAESGQGNTRGQSKK